MSDRLLVWIPGTPPPPPPPPRPSSSSSYRWRLESTILKRRFLCWSVRHPSNPLWIFLHVECCIVRWTTPLQRIDLQLCLVRFHQPVPPHSCCVHFRPWCARSSGAIMIMDVHLTIFEHCIIFWHATLSLRHPHTCCLNWWWISAVETHFAHKKPHHTTNFFAARHFQCRHHYMPCVGCYPHYKCHLL